MNEEIFSSNMIMEGMAELVLNTGNQTDLEVHSGKNTLPHRQRTRVKDKLTHMINLNVI